MSCKQPPKELWSFAMVTCHSFRPFWNDGHVKDTYKKSRWIKKKNRCLILVGYLVGYLKTLKADRAWRIKQYQFCGSIRHDIVTRSYQLRTHRPRLDHEGWISKLSKVLNWKHITFQPWQPTNFISKNMTSMSICIKKSHFYDMFLDFCRS